MLPDTCESVLVVDDDADLREVLVDLLEDEGYRTTTAANGQAAIERLRAGDKPNVILLDLMMPIMDGFQFRAAQRAEPGLKDIPVVVLSASVDIPFVAKSMGAAGGLQKPFKAEALLSTLERVCGPPPVKGRK